MTQSDLMKRLDNALDKTVIGMEKGLKDIDRGFSPLKKMDLYKNADTKTVKEKEKELSLLLA